MMMAPEGEGSGDLRMSPNYADWTQGVNAGSSIPGKKVGAVQVSLLVHHLLQFGLPMLKRRQLPLE
jgi:hypothetical protein